ncbi:hypothetical protein MPSEU_000048400 [Mayamaea pseudoterrestris]|nr:hypothetical protein MPSEU_000048400 [Mayamaea pseudoterrestris]
MLASILAIRVGGFAVHRGVIPLRFVVTMPPRRSARLSGGSSSDDLDSDTLFNKVEHKPRRKRNVSTLNKKQKIEDSSAALTSGVISETETADSSTSSSSSTSTLDSYCLPRTRESSLLLAKKYTHVIGIDEAGRGPLAGPVVAAAAYAPINVGGIVDSKKITKESERERLYEEITHADSQAHWAVAVVSAARIDEINILQATLEAMTMAATALVAAKEDATVYQEWASIEHDGCYVVRSRCETVAAAVGASTTTLSTGALPRETTIALIDGNQLPPRMPIAAESIVKGDSKEYCIAVASILAKVTRDRLMNAYATKFPIYNFAQHKGYPTKAHKEAIAKHGAIAIHRRTFAPLKYMDFGNGVSNAT